MHKKKKHNYIYAILIIISIASVVAIVKPLTNNNLQGHLNMQYNDHYLDNDGLTTEDELKIGTDPLNPDSDNDGFSDGFEVKHNLDPLDQFSPCNPNKMEENQDLYNCFPEVKEDNIIEE